MSNSFIRGVGRLATDRYEFQDHVDGYNFRHVASSVDLDPSVTIGGVQRTTVQNAMSAAATAITNLEATGIPDATITGVKGLITLQGGDLAGSGSSATTVRVSGLQSRPINTSAPSANNVLSWNGSSWGPAAIPEASTTVKGIVSLQGDIAGSADSVSVTKIQGMAVATNPGFITPGYVLTWSGSQWYAESVASGLVGYTTGASLYNVAYGVDSGVSITSGGLNSFVGYSAGKLNTSGGRNTAMGYISLTSCTTGAGNTCFGSESFRDLTTQSNNVGLGLWAGLYITGSDNTALGTQALVGALNQSTGTYNIAIGRLAMYDIRTGSENIAIGRESLRGVITGNNNIGIGKATMYAGVSGSDNIAIGLDSMKNISIVGNRNISAGKNSLLNGVSGDDNIAIGTDTMTVSQVTGLGNVSLGRGCNVKLTSGNRNVAIGYGTNVNLTSGSDNICMGNLATTILDSSSNCVCLGNSATSYDGSVSIGNNSTSAAANGIAIGPFATVSGNFYGVAIGSGSNVSLSYGIAIGNSANAARTGSIAIGQDATINSVAAQDGAIQIGTGINNVAYAGFKSLQIGQNYGHGSFSINYYKCLAYQWIDISDRRVKDKIEPLSNGLGLDFINKLNPVSYFMINGSNLSQVEYDKVKKKNLGLIAQEVQDVVNELNLNLDCVSGSEETMFALNYNSFIAPLIKSVQELSSKVNKLEDDNNNLVKELNLLKSQVNT